MMCGGGVYFVCGCEDVVWCVWFVVCVVCGCGGLGHPALRSGGAHPTPTDPPANTLSSHHRRLRAQTRNVQKTNGEKGRKINMTM